jgi:hypothetical protein
VLVFVDPESSVIRVQKTVADFLRKQGMAAELIATSISSRGARLSLPRLSAASRPQQR